ncbi:hypothetical protein HAX54_005921 [Datura stramonium]|uniref:Uncharacterized protein n=1 Tax=Datura stramonium TaxID=4076 RepID=A0ABS8T9N6_DATST|nr:hypothetical protein [Datura stramonium]
MESQPVPQVGENNEVNCIINEERDDSSSTKKGSNEESCSGRKEIERVQKVEKAIIVWNPNNKEGEDNDIEESKKKNEMIQDKEKQKNNEIEEVEDSVTQG